MSRNVKLTDPRITEPVPLSTKISADTRRAIERASVDQKITVREVIELAIAGQFGLGGAASNEAKAS